MHQLFDILGGHVHFSKTDFFPNFKGQIHFSTFLTQIVYIVPREIDPQIVPESMKVMYFSDCTNF